MRLVATPPSCPIAPSSIILLVLCYVAYYRDNKMKFYNCAHLQPPCHHSFLGSSEGQVVLLVGPGVFSRHVWTLSIRSGLEVAAPSLRRSSMISPVYACPPCPHVRNVTVVTRKHHSQRPPRPLASRYRVAALSQAQVDFEPSLSPQESSCPATRSGTIFGVS